MFTHFYDSVDKSLKVIHVFYFLKLSKNGNLMHNITKQFAHVRRPIHTCNDLLSEMIMKSLFPKCDKYDAIF